MANHRNILKSDITLILTGDGWEGSGNANGQSHNGDGDGTAMGNEANNVEAAMQGVRWPLNPSGGALPKLYRCLPTVLCI